MKSEHTVADTGEYCPVCGAQGFAWAHADPESPFREGRCPHCGAVCWTVNGPDTRAYGPSLAMLMVD